ANVVVATGEPFAQGSRVRNVFVDGKLYEAATETNAGGQRGGAAAGTNAAATTSKKTIIKPGSYITPTPKEVLIRNATVLTVSKGTIKNGSVLIRDGKIAEVGMNIVAPS